MTYRKIGGIHWFTIGRLKFAFCVKRKPAKPRHIQAQGQLQFTD